MPSLDPQAHLYLGPLLDLQDHPGDCPLRQKQSLVDSCPGSCHQIHPFQVPPGHLAGLLEDPRALRLVDDFAVAHLVPLLDHLILGLLSPALWLHSI